MLWRHADQGRKGKKRRTQNKIREAEWRAVDGEKRTDYRQMKSIESRQCDAIPSKV